MHSRGLYSGKRNISERSVPFAFLHFFIQYKYLQRSYYGLS